MRKILAVLCLVFVLIGSRAVSVESSSSADMQVFLPIVFGTAPVSEVTVISSNAFVPYEGSSYLYIVGEVRNNAASNLRFAKATANLRNAAGDIVASSWSYVYIGIFAPGVLSPFMVIFNNPPAWATYDFTLTWSKTSHSIYELELSNVSAYFDSLDAFHVKGDVRNQYSAQHTSAKLFLTLYDSQGQVIGVAKTDISPATLVAGQQVPFDFSAYFWKYKPDRSKIARYLLRAFAE